MRQRRRRPEGSQQAQLRFRVRFNKQLKQYGWIHQMACSSEKVLFVAELLNWRVQKLVLHA